MMARCVLSAEINHETNTFSILPATIESFKKGWCHRGEEVFRYMAGTRTRIGAHIDAAKRYGWTLVQPIAALATPSGKSTADTWAELSGAVMEACDQRPIDGILLALHGAMVSEDQDDAEGDLLCRLRERLGPKIPIAVTLDLHANVTDAMATFANILIAYRTYPHIDGYERAIETSHLLNRAMEDQIQPLTTVARRPLLDGCDYGRTQGGPMPRLLRKAAQYQKNDPSVLTVTICPGFPWSDVAQAGPSVTVTGIGKREKFSMIAAELMAEVWETRHERSVQTVGLDEAMTIARRANLNGGKAPLVLADFSDNPGCGGYGDGVQLLRAMIENDLSDAAFACVADPVAAQECIAAGKGAKMNLSLGAKVDPMKYGPALSVSGTVERTSDGSFVCDGPIRAGVKLTLGPTAVLRVGGVRVLVTTNNVQVMDQQVFLSQGIDPKTYSIIALKSCHHFRAAFEPIACETLLVDSGGLIQLDLRRLTYHKVRRPISPLDMD